MELNSVFSAACVANNVFLALSGKPNLQKHETLLYAQACRSLQFYLRFFELDPSLIPEQKIPEERTNDDDCEK